MSRLSSLIRLPRKACTRLPMRLLGFCLLPNHFHLVLWPQADEQLGPRMQWLLTAHVHGYGKRYGGSGHVSSSFLNRVCTKIHAA
jgi:putative transposase